MTDERSRVQHRLIGMATEDPRITSAAVVGSLARGDGDQWSDLDLTFGVATGTPIDDVLRDWSSALVERFDAVRLLDLRSRNAIYRVFLLPSGLQVDVSFSPEADFAATTADFRLLFGSAKQALDPGPSPEATFGWAVLYALHARSSIERARHRQARLFIWQAGHRALDLACLRLGLPASHGKGYDALPAEVREAFDAGFTASLEPDDLRGSLDVVVEALLTESLRSPVALALALQGRLRKLFSI